MSLVGRIARLEARTPEQERWLCIADPAIGEDELRRRLREAAVAVDAELSILQRVPPPGQEGRIRLYPIESSMRWETFVLALEDWERGNELGGTYREAGAVEA